MLFSDRRQILGALAALPLAACGFSPAYAPDGAGQALRAQVRADDPSDANGFAFVAALEQRLGRPAAARYGLAYSITTSQRSGARVQDKDDTRITLFGSINYQLRDLATGQVATSGELRNFTNYSSTDTQLATQRAMEDAHMRLMRILADQVAARLIAALAQ